MSLINTVNLAALLIGLAGIAIGTYWLWFRSTRTQKPILSRPYTPQWMLVIVGSIVLVIAVASLWERIQTSKVYDIDVTVTGSQNINPADVRVFTSLAGEAKVTSPGHWTFRIPAAAMPTDSLTIFAESPFGVGSTTVKPGLSSHINVALRLATNKGTIVKGIVIDESGKPIPNAYVTIPGSGEVVTELTGNFTIPTRREAGTEVPLHVEKEGYLTLSEYVVVSDEPVVLRLVRSRSLSH